MGYNLLTNGIYWGYNRLTNHLLTSWDIQVDHILGVSNLLGGVVSRLQVVIVMMPNWWLWLPRGTTHIQSMPKILSLWLRRGGTTNTQHRARTQHALRSKIARHAPLYASNDLVHSSGEGFFAFSSHDKTRRIYHTVTDLVEMCRGTSGNAPCLHHGLHLNKTRWLGADFLWEPRARGIPFEAESCIANFDFGNLFCTCAELASSLCCMWRVDVM